MEQNTFTRRFLYMCFSLSLIGYLSLIDLYFSPLLYLFILLRTRNNEVPLTQRNNPVGFLSDILWMLLISVGLLSRPGLPAHMYYENCSFAIYFYLPIYTLL